MENMHKDINIFRMEAIIPIIGIPDGFDKNLA